VKLTQVMSLPVEICTLVGPIAEDNTMDVTVLLNQDSDEDRAPAMVSHVPINKVARQYICGRLQRQLRMYFGTSHLVNSQYAEHEDNFWTWDQKVCLPPWATSVGKALSDARRKAVIANDARRDRMEPQRVIAGVMNDLRRARSNAKSAYCLSAAARIDKILQSFSTSTSYEHLSELNMAMVREEDKFFLPILRTLLAPIVEMFQAICADEALLRANERVMAIMLNKVGLPPQGICSGWIYPVDISSAPQLMDFDADDLEEHEVSTTSNREKELDPRWFYDGHGRYLYSVFSPHYDDEELLELVRDHPALSLLFAHLS